MKNLLTAAEARKMMPMEQANKLVDFILGGVSDRAKSDRYDLVIGCPKDVYSESIRSEAVKILENLGYHVAQSFTENAVWFLVNWRE